MCDIHSVVYYSRCTCMLNIFEHTFLNILLTVYTAFVTVYFSILTDKFFQTWFIDKKFHGNITYKKFFLNALGKIFDKEFCDVCENDMTHTVQISKKLRNFRIFILRKCRLIYKKCVQGV